MWCGCVTKSMLDAVSMVAPSCGHDVVTRREWRCFKAEFDSHTGNWHVGGVIGDGGGGGCGTDVRTWRDHAVSEIIEIVELL